MNNLYERISALCDERGIKPGRMCNDLGISRGNITDLKMGRIESLSMDKILKISEYFSVSVDYLVGTATKKTPTPEGERKIDITQAKIALFGGDGEVTDEMWEEAIFAAQLIKDRHKRKKD